MRILGIESSSLVASVAIVTDDILTAEYTVNLKKTHSQTLLPMIDEVIRMLEIELDSIDAIAVECGFSSTSHFIRAFKKDLDFTPAVYRKFFDPSGFQKSP